MDNKQLTQRLAKTASLEYRETADLMQALTSLIVDTICDGDAIAVPGFGTFSPDKHDEEIITDLASGKKLLMPPSIEFKFTPGAQLKKNL